MHAERDSKGPGAEALRGEGPARKRAPWGHSCRCFPWLPPLLSKDLLMVSVRDARPFFTPLTTIITVRLEAVIAAAMEKSCQNTIKFQVRRERENRGSAGRQQHHAAGLTWPKIGKKNMKTVILHWEVLEGDYRRMIWAAQMIGLLKT